MPKLSIVIAYEDNSDALEQTLVSVLQNRPDNCEILLAHRGSYEDPYDLGDEIRFVQLPAEATLIDCLNQAVQQAAAPVVHVLRCAVEVEECWTAAALRHFHDPRVGMVSPLVVDARQPQQVVTAGVRLAWDLSRRQVDGASLEPTHKLRQPAGPSLVAGFYRRAAFLAAGGLDQRVGPALADLDLALSIAALGFVCRFEPQSRLFAPASAGQTPHACRGTAGGRAAAQLIWRHAPTIGWHKALLVQFLGAAIQWIRRPGHPEAWRQLWGRMLGCMQWAACLQHYQRLRHARRPELSPAAEASWRLDSSHLPAHPDRHRQQPSRPAPPANESPAIQ